MLLTNASILRLDLPGSPDPRGRTPYTQGPEIAPRRARCFVGEISRNQREALAELIVDARAVMSVSMADYAKLTAAGTATPAAGHRLSVSPHYPPGTPARPPVVRQVLHVAEYVKGSISHYKLFVRDLTESELGGGA